MPVLICFINFLPFSPRLQLSVSFLSSVLPCMNMFLQLLVILHLAPASKTSSKLLKKVEGRTFWQLVLVNVYHLMSYSLWLLKKNSNHGSSPISFQNFPPSFSALFASFVIIHPLRDQVKQKPRFSTVPPSSHHMAFVKFPWSASLYCQYLPLFTVQD